MSAVNTSKIINEILSSMPYEWKGTTFRNNNLLGREKFSENLENLIEVKTKLGEVITTKDLEDLGNAEDYLRVASNVATTLEFFLGKENGYSVEHVFTFASTTMTIVAVLLTSNTTVHLYTGEKKSPFTEEQIKLLQLFGAQLVIHENNEIKREEGREEEINLSLFQSKESDAFIEPNVLYINNTKKIKPNDILVIRKRMATPITTPFALSMLSDLAGNQKQSNPPINSDDEAAFLAHLQTLSGTDRNPQSNPVLFSAGLPTTASLWITLAANNGAEILMASTAYGGSSQLVDILTKRSMLLRKHTFHIQGDSNIIESIEQSLHHLMENTVNLHPLTVLFVEIPTNPDMKVPDPKSLAMMLQSFIQKTGKQVLLLIDTTFAPGSKVMHQFKEIIPDLPVMAFISLSKSVSRGMTTAGALVANHTPFAISLLHRVRETAEMLDTTAKYDQIQSLIENHNHVEERCQNAYKVAAEVGNRLCESVKRICSYDMPLAFVTPDHATNGFTSSTFSFNLPPIAGASDDVNAALAQNFVDLICEHHEFKPCVSFGQDNGLVYATVPATSTQGAIKEEDKAKQAIGGVQLVRLSFAPTVNADAVSKIMNDAIAKIYGN